MYQVKSAIVLLWLRVNCKTMLHFCCYFYRIWIWSFRGDGFLQ